MHHTSISLKYIVSTCILVIASVIIIGCNEESIVGSGLLAEEEINLAYRDDYQLRGVTVRGDSVATFRGDALISTYLLGELDDPIFGRSTSDIYLALRRSSAVPDFSAATLDSVVLELEYDEEGFYGDTSAVHTIEVFRVIEDWVIEDDSIFSDRSFMTDMSPIGSKTFQPSLTRTIPFKVRDLTVDSVIQLSPRLSIPLDNAYGQEIMDNLAAAESDSAFLAAFKGLRLVSTVDGSSMIGLNFSEASDTEYRGIYIYYTVENADGEEEKRRYQYRIRAETYSQFQHAYQGAFVDDYLGSTTLGEQYLFSQSMSGVDCELFLPDLSDIKGNLINSAQLVLTLADDDGAFSTDLYPPRGQYLISYRSADGEPVLVDDLLRTNNNLTNLLALLDGSVREVSQEDGSVIETVTFNITDYIRRIIEEESTTASLIISPIGRSESPRRVVFYGTEHPDYPAQLRIAYTKI